MTDWETELKEILFSGSSDQTDPYSVLFAKPAEEEQTEIVFHQPRAFSIDSFDIPAQQAPTPNEKIEFFSPAEQRVENAQPQVFEVRAAEAAACGCSLRICQLLLGRRFQ